MARDYKNNMLYSSKAEFNLRSTPTVWVVGGGVTFFFQTGGRKEKPKSRENNKKLEVTERWDCEKRKGVVQGNGVDNGSRNKEWVNAWCLKLQEREKRWL